MNMSDLSRVIEQVGKDRGIKKEVIVEALEQAVLMAAQKKFGVGARLEAHYNHETGEIELFQFKTVVEDENEIGDPDVDIALEEARKLDPTSSSATSSASSSTRRPSAASTLRPPGRSSSRKCATPSATSFTASSSAAKAKSSLASLAAWSAGR